MTQEGFLVFLTVIVIIGLLITSVIWWIGTDIVHELRHRNFLLKKQKYSYSQGIDWGKCKVLDHFYIEHGVEYTLFGVIKWKWITKKTSKVKPKQR